MQGMQSQISSELYVMNFSLSQGEEEAKMAVESHTITPKWAGSAGELEACIPYSE